MAVYNAVQDNQLPQPPPPPPPLKAEDENDNTSLIDEVSNLVNKIVKNNKNVNLEKIKQQINLILESNSSDIDESNKEGKVDIEINLQSENPIDNTQTVKTNQFSVKDENNTVSLPNVSVWLGKYEQ